MNGRTGGLECRQGGKIKTRGQVLEVDGREDGLRQRVQISDGGRTIGSRKGISYSVFCTRNIDDITSKLRDISQMTLLTGGPRRRRSEQGVSQRLVIREQGKLPPHQ